MEQKTKNVSSDSLSFTTNDIIQVGLMAAITFVATSLIHIPSFMGVVHLGDSMIFIVAILLRRKKAAAAAAIGMTLFDLLNGYTAWAPFTFLIKGVMAYIAGSIAYRGKFNGNSTFNNILAFIIAGLFMIAAYYFSGVIMAKYIVVKAATINQAFLLALKDIPGNIAQVVAGIIIAVPLSISLKKFKL
jgi:uncharacterized membrane protein